MLNLRNRDKSNEEDPRQRDIDNILDSDVRMNRRVVDKEREFIALFMDNLKEAPQLDRNVMVKTQKEADRINKLLVDLKSRLEQVKLLTQQELQTPTKRDIVYKGLNYSEIILFYNDLIRSYKDPEVSFVSKEAVKTNIQGVVPLINEISFLIDDIIDKKFLRFGAANTPLDDGNYDINSANNQIKVVSKLCDLYLKQFLSMYATFRFIQSSLLKNNYDLVSDENIEVEYNKILAEFPAGTKNLIDGVVGNFSLDRTRAQKQAFERRKKLIESDNQAPLTSDQVSVIRNQIFGVPDRSRYIVNPVREQTIIDIIAANTDAATGNRDAGSPLSQEQYDLYRDLIQSYTDYKLRNSLENADRARGFDLALHTMNDNIRDGFPPHYQPPNEPYQTERYRASVLNRPEIPIREADVEESKGAYRGTTNLTTEQQISEKLNKAIKKTGTLINSLTNTADIQLPFIFTNVAANNRTKVTRIKTRCLDFWKNIYKLKFNVNPSVVTTDAYIADIEAKYPLIDIATIADAEFLRDTEDANRDPVNEELQRLKDDTVLIADDLIDELTRERDIRLQEMEQQQRRSANIVPMIEGQGRRKFKKYSDLEYRDGKNEMYDY